MWKAFSPISLLMKLLTLQLKLFLNTTLIFPLARLILKRLFSFATSRTNFLFNGCYYDQIDGVAMGSPLATILANLFMGFHEDQWLSNYKDFQVLFYLRYVDDTFFLIS